jgi:hypothetical protein
MYSFVTSRKWSENTLRQLRFSEVAPESDYFGKSDQLTLTTGLLPGIILKSSEAHSTRSDRLSGSETTMETTNYTVRRYNDGKAIGSVDLTTEQFRRYESMSQQPEGLIRLGAMPHDLYELDAEYQDTHEDTTIYLD